MSVRNSDKVFKINYLSSSPKENRMVMEDGASKSSEINTDKIITFPRGIPGFEKYTTYIVYHKDENGLSAYWLESTEESAITFTLVAPEHYGLAYELDLSDEDMELLQTEDVNELGVFMILSKKEENGMDSPVLNANIAGPIIINPKTRLGVQKVIHRTLTPAKITLLS